MTPADWKNLVITVAGGLTVLAIAAVLALVVRALFRLRIVVEEANARYLAPGLRMPRTGEAHSVMVHDDLPADLLDALLLDVHVRLGLRNRGPVAKTLAGVRLVIGSHDGKEVSGWANDSEGKRFTKCEVGRYGGYESVDLRFSFGPEDYGKGGFDFSEGARYLLEARPAVGGAKRFELDVTPAARPTDPARVTVRRLRWPWNHAALTETLSGRRLLPRRSVEAGVRERLGALIQDRIAPVAHLNDYEPDVLVGWGFSAATGVLNLTYPISGEDGNAVLRAAEDQMATAVRSDGNRETLKTISRLHSEIVEEARNWADVVRLRGASGHNDLSLPA